MVFRKDTRVRCSYTDDMGDCLPPHIAFSVFCKHSVPKLVVNGFNRLAFELLTQAPCDAERISKKKAGIQESELTRYSVQGLWERFNVAFFWLVVIFLFLYRIGLRRRRLHGAQSQVQRTRRAWMRGKMERGIVRQASFVDQ
jgi:hypothetical protein